MTGLASRVSAICFSSASSGVPSTSSTKCLPWRTLRHAVVAEAPQCAEHRLPLGVGDLRLEDDVDDHPGHADEGTGRDEVPLRSGRSRLGLRGEQLLADGLPLLERPLDRGHLLRAWPAGRRPR